MQSDKFNTSAALCVSHFGYEEVECDLVTNVVLVQCQHSGVCKINPIVGT